MGDLRSFCGFGELSEEEKGSCQNEQYGDGDSLKISHCEKQQMLFILVVSVDK